MSELRPSPDADLLALCAWLSEMQAEWQRLWDATPDAPDGSPADQALEAYARTVWPAPNHLAIALAAHRPVTLDGWRAKGAAILAMEQAGGYTDAYQDETGLLLMSLAKDAAGPSYLPVGDASAP